MAAHSSCKINWELCVLCQSNIVSENLVCPDKGRTKSAGMGYLSLAEHLMAFHKINQLPKTINIENLDEGEGIETTLKIHNAKWHKSCRLKYNNKSLERAKKTTDLKSDNMLSTRSRKSLSHKIGEALCFFCGKEAGHGNPLHSVTTIEMEKRVRESAERLQDTNLLGKLSSGDMVALEARYHSKCLVQLHNRARATKSQDTEANIEDQRNISGIAFAELVSYIEDARIESSGPHIFKLSKLAELYDSRMIQLGAEKTTKVHTTRLKDRLLANIPNIEAVKEGRDILLTFRDVIAETLKNSLAENLDSDALCIARTAKIIRRHLFSNTRPFNGSFGQNCEKESVPDVLIALVNMILQGPNIKKQAQTTVTKATLTIAQLLKFNSTKYERMKADSSVTKHSIGNETPLALYIGLLLHATTRKRQLIDKLSHFGICISYDRVLRLSSQLGNSVLHHYETEGVVCPPSLRSNVFTSAAVDNIDHNPSSTTSKDSFHGTAISLIQHTSHVEEGIIRNIEILVADNEQKSIKNLPYDYTTVQPVNVSLRSSKVPPTKSILPNESNCDTYKKKEKKWLDMVRDTVEEPPSNIYKNISWAAYHASLQSNIDKPVQSIVLLPLFHDAAHSVAMIKHAMDVIQKATDYLNAGQAPVITFDQPLYAIAKQIQWQWPDRYGEDKFVIFFGGLHIEMAGLKTVGDWLRGSGWTQALVKANIANSGTADSFLRASHISRTRRAHQITAAALHTLLHRAYRNYVSKTENTEVLDFDTWTKERMKHSPHFHYWSIVLSLELNILIYVRSIRESNFSMYLDSLTELAPWFFALDHTNYARWITIHLRDMSDLSINHPDVALAFKNGKFTVKKSKRSFSTISIDHAHEQMNACIKGDGGAVGLTENPSALRRWMIAGPEISRLINEFEDSQEASSTFQNFKHHEQTFSIQDSFETDVRSLTDAFEEFGNPFEEDSKDLLVLDTKVIAPDSVAETIRNAERIGQEQFKSFIKDRLVDRVKPTDDVLPRNKLTLFSTPIAKGQGKVKSKLASIKSDLGLFSRLYVACQSRQGDIEEFFAHENQSYPPSISENGSLRHGTKSDLLLCMEDYYTSGAGRPLSTCSILDGPVIVQMLQPGAAKTFKEYANSVFIPYLKEQVQNACRLDIVFDIYLPKSLKASTRGKRGSGVRARVADSSPIPRNWQTFLRVDENKSELFKYLSNSALEAFKMDDKEFVVTNGSDIFSVPFREDKLSLEPCNHEEADTRVLIHAADACEKGHLNIQIRTVDTDVVVLSIMAFTKLKLDELWIAFGTGKGFRYLPVHEISISIGPQKSLALPLFHALTGCDTVSSFANHGKKTAWKIWRSFPELTEALINISPTNTNITDLQMSIIERFVILMYDRTSTCTNINEARRVIFSRHCNSLENIPPTKAALEQHVKRAIYQGAICWGQTLNPIMDLPRPEDWGWRLLDSSYEPYWTSLPEASKICHELIHCGCKKGCGTLRCKCRASDLSCTALCECDGKCDGN